MKAIHLPGLVLLALLSSVLPAAMAEPPAESAKPADTAEVDEVIVTGRRNGEPDFQEQQEYHDQEYRRLKQIYDPDSPAIPRSDQLTRMPEAVSPTVQGKPTLTERF
jgi:hypothetical protein